jgi:hypothetical protein
MVLSNSQITKSSGTVMGALRVHHIPLTSVNGIAIGYLKRSMFEYGARRGLVVTTLI